jgi:hypothetical protein
MLMLEQQTADLGSLMETLEKSGAAPDSAALASIAMAIAKLFNVKQDEVAVLKVVPKYKSLKFVLPEKLSNIGTIPLTSATALASRTARENKPELANNFSTARHANVFEAVPLGRDRRELIHKIMSAPILEGKRVQGVIQISRKSATLAEAGADFTQVELKKLVSLSATLDRFLKLCKVD